MGMPPRPRPLPLALKLLEFLNTHTHTQKVMKNEKIAIMLFVYKKIYRTNLTF
jgi:hypothetical protein